MILKKALTTVLFAIIILAGPAQSPFSSRTFHAHVQTCHLAGTIEYDYLIQLRADSTIVWTIYSSNYKTQYKTVIKEMYQGRYSESEGSIKADFFSYKYLSREKGNKSRLFRANQSFPVTTNRVQYFILKSDTLISGNQLIPSLSKVNPVKFDWLDTKFEGWQNKDLMDNEIFGL